MNSFWFYETNYPRFYATLFRILILLIKPKSNRITPVEVIIWCYLLLNSGRREVDTEVFSFFKIPVSWMLDIDLMFFVGKGKFYNDPLWA